MAAQCTAARTPAPGWALSARVPRVPAAKRDESLLVTRQSAHNVKLVCKRLAYLRAAHEVEESVKGRRGPRESVFAGAIWRRSRTRSAVTEVELSDALEQFVQLANRAHASRQQALLERFGRAAAVIVGGGGGGGDGGSARAAAVESRWRRPARERQGAAGRPARVQVSVRLEQSPQVAIVGDGVLEQRGGEQRLLVGGHALQQDLLEQILEARGQVNSRIARSSRVKQSTQ